MPRSVGPPLPIGPLQIEDDVYQLRAYASQVFALIDEDGVTLIDAGAPGSGRLILRQLRDLGYAPADIRRIILTHYHIDHRGGAGELVATSNAEVLAHGSEAPFLRGERPYPNPVQKSGLRALTGPLFKAMRGRPLSVTALEDGESLEVLGGLQVHHSPGHTRGSIALSLPDRGLLFSGDVMGYSRHELELPDSLVSEDVETARASLERLARLDIDAICFSHFQPMRQGAHEAMKKMVGTWEQSV